MEPANPVNPQRVFYELSSRLPDNCILTGDSGSSAFWYARDLQMRQDMAGSLSGGLARMGSAEPYAIAAKFAHPDRMVIAMAGGRRLPPQATWKQAKSYASAIMKGDSESAGIIRETVKQIFA